MLTGSPPFGLFFSEMTILRAGFLSAHVGATAVFLAALVVLFCGFFFQAGRLTLGAQPHGDQNVPEPETLDLGMGTTFVAAVLAVGSAFYLPPPLLSLIRAAARVVWEGA